MPSIFTLEGPRLGAVVEYPTLPIVVDIVTKTPPPPPPTPPKQQSIAPRFSLRPASMRTFRGIEGSLGIAPWKLLVVGLGVAAGVFGLHELRQRHEDKRHRKGLRGSSMLRTIAREAKSPAEYARRVEAWNAAEVKPLPVAKLARAYGRGKPTAVARLIRQAHEARIEGRERLWSKMSRGLRGLIG